MLSVYVQNVKTVDDVANYDYFVMVNKRMIAAGKIEGHKRSDGWQPLVKRIAEGEGVESGKE
jgi:hypothetical protein